MKFKQRKNKLTPLVLSQSLPSKSTYEAKKKWLVTFFPSICWVNWIINKGMIFNLFWRKHVWNETLNFYAYHCVISFIAFFWVLSHSVWRKFSCHIASVLKENTNLLFNMLLGFSYFLITYFHVFSSKKKKIMSMNLFHFLSEEIRKC